MRAGECRHLTAQIATRAFDAFAKGDILQVLFVADVAAGGRNSA